RPLPSLTGSRDPLSGGDLAGGLRGRSGRRGSLLTRCRGLGGRRLGAAAAPGAGAAEVRGGPARVAGDQPRDVQGEQPQAGDGQRREGQTGDEREHVMVAVERPVPQQIVAEGKSGHEDQRPVGHVPNPRVLRGRTDGGIAARSARRPMIARHERGLSRLMSGAGDGSEIFAPGLLGGRSALVTGGGTGLGRRTEVLEQTAGEIGAIAGPVEWVGGDVRTREDADRLVRTVLERQGRLDLLVNNARGQYFTPAELIAAQGW